MSVNNHRKCAKCGKTRAEDMTVNYHRFPIPGKTNITKARAWAKYCWPNQDWTSEESLLSLYNSNKVLCGRHFSSNQFYDDYRQKLSKFAVPDSGDVVALLHERDNVFQQPNSSVPSQSQKRPVSSNDKSDTDEADEEASIYERDEQDSIRIEENESDAGDAGDATVPEGSSRRHEGYICDVCSGDIVGFRYACVQCANLDLCGACEARGEHAQHYVLRIPHTKLNSDVQSIIRKIRDQLLERNDEEAIKIEVKDEVLDLDEEQDPLGQTACPAAEKLPEASCEDMECESEDALALKFLGRSERGKQPVFEASLSHQPAVPQVLTHRHKQKPQDPSHHSQVLSHQPAVPQVPTHQPQVLSHEPQVVSHPTAVPRQPKILIQQSKIVTQKKKIQSGTPQAPSSQPQVPRTTSQEKRPLMLEVRGVGAAPAVAGAAYAVYTHSADDEDAPSAELPSVSVDEESKPTRKRRKK